MSPPNVSSTHLAPSLVITMLLTIPWAVLYIPGLCCNYQFVLLNTFAFLPRPLILPPTWQPSIWSLYLWVCFCFVWSFILFFKFHIWVKSSGICLSLTDLLHLALYPHGPAILSKRYGFILFYGHCRLCSTTFFIHCGDFHLTDILSLSVIKFIF